MKDAHIKLLKMKNIITMVILVAFLYCLFTGICEWNDTYAIIMLVIGSYFGAASQKNNNQ